MRTDTGLDIRHTSVIHFHVVPVEDFVKGIMSGEVNIKQTKELLAYIGLDSPAVWWIIFLPLLRRFALEVSESHKDN